MLPSCSLGHLLDPDSYTPHVVRLALLDTKPVFQYLGDKSKKIYVEHFNKLTSITRSFHIFVMAKWIANNYFLS